jgi:hypothetical protein
MDTDVYYDIPIYKTLPTIIRNDEYTKSKEKEKIQLYDISIEKIYQSEPFSNYRNNYTIIILFFIIIIIFLYNFFIGKKN